MSDGVGVFLEAVAARARASGVFGSVSVRPGMLVCAAKNSAEPAEYRITHAEGKLWVSIVTANRWLSESIESDLEHTGDEVDELIEEELVELSYGGAKPGPSQHFRSDDKLFTFRSTLPTSPGASDSASVDAATTCLLAYEACFRRLGDMDAGPQA
jgi:hypothetical protein